MDRKRECCTIPWGLFRKDSCPENCSGESNGLRTDRGYMLAGIEFSGQIVDLIRTCQMPYIAVRALLAERDGRDKYA